MTRGKEEDGLQVDMKSLVCERRGGGWGLSGLRYEVRGGSGRDF